MHLLDLFAIHVLERPEAPALVPPSSGTETGARLTYGELDARVGRAAAALSDRGVARGDRVAFFADGSIDLVVAHLATLLLAAIAVPINLAYTEREIGHILGDAEPRLVIADADRRETIERVPTQRRRSVEQIAALGEIAAGSPRYGGTNKQAAIRGDGSSPALLVYTSGTTGKSKGAVITHDNLLATVTGLLAAWAWRPEDVLLLALPLFHVHGLVVGLHTALAAGASVRLHRRFDADRVLDELTAGESTAEEAIADSATADSATADRSTADGSTADRSTADESTATTADRDRVTLFFGVPTLYVRLLEAIRRRNLDRGLARSLTRSIGPEAFSRLRLLCSGSAPLAPELFEAFREATGHAILERYGMTETGMNLSNPYAPSAGPRRPGTVGVPLPGVSVRIVALGGRSGDGEDNEIGGEAGNPSPPRGGAETAGRQQEQAPVTAQIATQIGPQIDAQPGAEHSAQGSPIEDVPPGETGELLVRGSNVFAGYWRDPAKTAAAFVTDRDGDGRRWFRTGDLARRDPATGYYTLLGRSRELILRGGLNVYPREVEEVLEALPGVAEAAVAGRSDPEYGEVPVAFVVRADGAAPEVDALLAGCRERLAAFKVPVAVRFVEELPRNALGKVQKHRLPS